MDNKSIRPVIDKGIPIPGQSTRGKSKTTRIYYPFADMLVGDSFFLENVDPDRILAAAWKSKYDGHLCKDWKFETRTVQGGIRCWRTA